MEKQHKLQMLTVFALFASQLALSGLILADVNITDVKQAILDVVGIIGPVLLAFIPAVIAYAVMSIVMGVGEFPNKLLSKMLNRISSVARTGNI